MESLVSNHLPEIKNLFKKYDIDLIAEETLSQPFLIESINQSKIQLI